MSVSLSRKQGQDVVALAGDVAALRLVLDEAALVVATGEAGKELDALRCMVAAEANEAGETPRGHLEAVVELL
jgi:ribosomal silencing factor RsfS